MSEFFAQVQATILAVLVSVSSIGAPMPTPIPTPTADPTLETIQSNGEYTYMGQKLTYTLSFPKNGGPVTGKVEGFCKGGLTGNYEGPKSGKTTVSGEVVCLGFQHGAVNFEGDVDIQSKKIRGNAKVKSEVYNGTYPVELSL